MTIDTQQPVATQDDAVAEEILRRTASQETPVPWETVRERLGL